VLDLNIFEIFLSEYFIKSDKITDLIKIN